MITEKYTVEQAEQVKGDYLMGTSVEDIASNIGKSTRSVIAKLAQLGVYKTKAKVGTLKVTKVTKVTKVMLISMISSRHNLPMAKLATLEKASLEALELIAAL